MSILSLINADNFRTYNLHIAKRLGSVSASIMLSELAQRLEYHKKNNELTTLKNQDGEWFYYTHECCEERTCLSRDEQDPALKLLINLGLIKKVIANIPPRRYFQIDEKKTDKFLTDSKNVYNLRKIHKSRCGKSTNRYEENPQNNKERRYKREISPKIDIDTEKENRSISDRFSEPSGDRSSDIRQIIDFFDPHTYKTQDKKYLFPDGSQFSDRFINSLKKYSQEELRKFKIALHVLQDQIEKGNHIKKYESYLQSLIKEKIEDKNNNSIQNSLMAAVLKEESKCNKMKILKTCVQFFDDKGRKIETISFQDLPCKEFKRVALHYIEKCKNL